MRTKVNGISRVVRSLTPLLAAESGRSKPKTRSFLRKLLGKQMRTRETLKLTFEFERGDPVVISVTKLSPLRFLCVAR